MATINKGIYLRFGLAAIPVDIVTTKEGEKSRTSMYCTADDKGKAHPPAKVSQQFKCSHCERVGSGLDFGKGTEREGAVVALTSDDLATITAAVDEETKTTMAITAHDAQEVLSSTVPAGKFYYLKPGKGCPASFYAGFAKMVEAAPDKAFVTIFTSRTAPSMYRLGVRNHVLTLEALAWPDEILAAPAVPTEFEAGLDTQLAAVVEALSTPFDPSTFKDARKEVFAQFVAAKAGEPGIEAPVTAPKTPTAGGDLMSLLQATVAAAPKKAAKTAAKKAPAKKATARKAS